MFHIRNLGFIWMAVFALLVLASVTRGMGWVKEFGLDIMFHIGIYALLTFLSIQVFRKFETVVLPVSLSLVSALFFEILHGTINGYGFEDGDYLLNNLGVFIGAVAAVASFRLFGQDSGSTGQISERPPAKPGPDSRGLGDIF
jgi:hypothetical protein